MAATKWGNATSAAIEAAEAVRPVRNGNALDARQIKSKKEEIVALLKTLTSPEADAIRKITELI